MRDNKEAPVPEEALCKGFFCRTRNLAKKTPSLLYRYGIFLVILTDLIGLLLKYTNNYSVTIYVLLTQLAYFVLVFNCGYENRPKKFCLRKRIAFKSLGLYYLIGFISVLCRFDNDFYNYIVSPIILLAVAYILYVTRNE